MATQQVTPIEQRGYAHPEVLVSTDYVAQHLSDRAMRFVERYEKLKTDAARQVELEVLGVAVGSNGYSTLEQADRLAEILGLGPDSRLLDIGAGLGWPGLRLSQRTGCEVAVLDLPVNALQGGRSNARERGLEQRATFVRASATHLPFGDRTFDAVVHTDVLC